MVSELMQGAMFQLLSYLFCSALLLDRVSSRPQTILSSSDESPDINILLQKIAPRQSGKSLDRKNFPRFTPKEESFAECANGSTFCETIKDYPSGHINEMFRREAIKQQFENRYEVEVSPVGSERGPESKPLCKSVTNTIFPNVTKKDETTGQTKVFSMKTGMEVEECIQSGTCSGNEKMPDGFKALCKQKYVYTSLVMHDESGAESKQQYLLPSGCVCSLKTVESSLKLKDVSLLLLNEYLAKP